MKSIKDELEQIKQLIEQNNKDIALEKLKKLLASTSQNDVLLEIASIYQQMGEYGEGINTCNKILEKTPDHKKAKALKDLLTELLKFTQLDIYASTNLWNDPWFD